MKNRCASVATLAQVKLDCDPTLIRSIWRAATREDLLHITDPAGVTPEESCLWKMKAAEIKRAAVDRAGGFHGLEYLGVDRRTGLAVYYCNAGDTYATTIFFQGSRLYVSTVGDEIESGRIAEAGGQWLGDGVYYLW